MDNKKVLDYHHRNPSGKLAVIPTKPLKSANDLSIAYTPGVAIPCQAIAKDPAKVYDYTTKGNLVAVVTNGTAVLGLGNLGPAAAKPVMEGKAILMKKLAGIDSFDLEIAAYQTDQLVSIIQALAPTFGGINLEDIQAPVCFEVEKRLQKAVDIPVMHDDQHSTAIVVAAALKNALLLAKKSLSDVQIVIHGAGAGAIASATLLHIMGVPKAHMIMIDSQGVIHSDRTHIPSHKLPFVTTRPVRTLAQAINGADVFIGLSVGNVLTPAHLSRMTDYPIVFALANPQPEIDYKLAHATRKDLIMSTGRSDYPNQVNNVLAFPYIFRGLLDVRATQLHDGVKTAAVEAIASLVHQSKRGLQRSYFIPEPMDKRLLTTVAPAVANAAMKHQIARTHIQDWDHYLKNLTQDITAYL